MRTAHPPLLQCVCLSRRCVFVLWQLPEWFWFSSFLGKLCANAVHASPWYDRQGNVLGLQVPLCLGACSVRSIYIVWVGCIMQNHQGWLLKEVIHYNVAVARIQHTAKRTVTSCANTFTVQRSQLCDKAACRTSKFLVHPDRTDLHDGVWAFSLKEGGYPATRAHTISMLALDLHTYKTSARYQSV